MRPGRQRLGTAGGFCLGLALGWLLWSDAGLPALSWPDGLGSGDPVLVIVVETRENLEIVRGAVAPDRIVVSTEAGLAISPHRVVATSLERAGTLVTKTGWHDRPLEIVAIDRRTPDRDASDDERVDIASLVNKPTLTRAEAYRLLRTL